MQLIWCWPSVAYVLGHLQAEWYLSVGNTFWENVCRANAYCKGRNIWNQLCKWYENTLITENHCYSIGSQHAGIIILKPVTHLVELFTILTTGVRCNIEYPPENYLKINSSDRFDNFAQSTPVILRVLYLIQSDWTSATDVMDGRVFAIFLCKMSFGWISYIAQHP